MISRGYYLMLFLFLIAACKQVPDLGQEEKAILALLDQERKAHFERDAELFIGEFAPDMISVNKGSVLTASPGERKNRIQGYFDSVDFIKWDNTAEPQIRFSKDGSLAYAIVQKEVIVKSTDTTKLPGLDTTYYAWLSVYRKQAGAWKVECNVSTNK